MSTPRYVRLNSPTTRRLLKSGHFLAEKRTFCSSQPSSGSLHLYLRIVLPASILSPFFCPHLPAFFAQGISWLLNHCARVIRCSLAMLDNSHMTATQTEFSLVVAICAWCKPDERGSGLGAISHGICLRHLRKLKLQTQGLLPKRAPRTSVHASKGVGLETFLPL